jgi:IS605 OrfB family transposase
MGCSARPAANEGSRGELVPRYHAEMIVTYQFRLVPSKQQHRALEQLLESQRLLYNAALEERLGAYRHGISRGYIGIDLGISTFAALSDGGFIPSVNAARRAEGKLRRARRCLSRKQRNSKARSKARIGVMRCCAATARARSNHLHQASARLVRDYDVIAVEALNVQGLARGALAREIHDASWGKFLLMLSYKAERAGVRLIKVDARDSTQDCSGCKVRVPKRLEHRWHACPHCGLSIDRDLNAARNVLDRAGVSPSLRNVAGCGKRAGMNLSLNGRAKMQPTQSKTLPE